MNNKNLFKAGFIPFLIALYQICNLLPPVCRGVSFAGGTGEPNDPYQIATVDQLTSMGSDRNLLSKHYLLVADLDLDPNLPGGRAFDQAVIAPSLLLTFYGSFDGAGHTIRNVVVNGYDYSGLFGRVGEEGILKNLGVENVNMNGRRYVGGLVGVNNGTVSSCHATGVVVAQERNVGGLAGSNYGTITLSYSTGTVEAWGETAYAGGLTGYNDDTVSYCLSTARVTGLKTVGGLVGANQDVSLIFSSYSTGSVTGSDLVGGLVGNNIGMICASYSTSAVPGFISRAGGLVGYNILSNSGDGRGGVLTNVVLDWIIDDYFLVLSDGGGPDNGYGKALSTAQMQQRDLFIGFDFWGSKEDGLGESWFMPPDSPPVLAWQREVTGMEPILDVKGLSLEEATTILQAAGHPILPETQMDYDRTIPADRVLRTYPISYALPDTAVELVMSKGPYDWSTNPGNGTGSNPYQIRTKIELDALVDRPDLWGKHFVQTADIDLATRSYSSAPIAPDVNDAASDFQGTAFTGSLNGNGFKIKNLGIATEMGDFLGLFGCIAEGAVVTKVNLVNARIRGGITSNHVGTMAGYNLGTIQDCTATGMVRGSTMYLGELTGDNDGTVKDCYTIVAEQKLSQR